MDPSGATYNLFILTLLLTFSAFFSASETALFSVNKIKLRNLADKGDRQAEKVLTLLKNPEDLLSTILIMNNLVNITISSLTSVFMYNFLGKVGVSIATGIVTILVLLFGEITPKTLAIDFSEKISLKVVDIIIFLVTFLKPIVFIFKSISKRIKTIGGRASNSIITEDELKTILAVSEENGVLDTSEKEMIYKVFSFGDLVAKDVMVPKMNISGLDYTSSYSETMKMIKEEKYSRVPVYKDSIDNIVGILNVKDLLFENIEEENFNLNEYIRKPNQTYEYKNVQDIFKEMKRIKTHMIVVLDEYGATKGIITMEDLVEEIVGDIDDEYDTIEDKEIVKISEKKYIVSGSTKVGDIVSKLNVVLDTNNKEYDSIGGYFISNFGGFPIINDYIENKLFKLTISEMDKKAIKKVQIEFKQ